MLAAIGGEGEHVGGAALHPDGGERAAARAGVGAEQDAVAEVVAQDRLDAVGELLTRTVCESSPGGTGRWSASTGSTMAQSLLTWYQPCSQLKLRKPHSVAA